MITRMRVLVLGLGILSMPASLACQGGGGQWAAAARRIGQADRLLEEGRYREARAAYSEAEKSARGNAFYRATALFGQALSAQQALAVGSDPGVSGDSVLTGYLAARRLDSSRLFGAASNNAGLLLRSRGRHRDALRYFLDAAKTTHPARAYFYLNAGREYDRLGKADSAASMYRNALQVDPGYADARQALLQLYVARSSPDSLLSAARKWTGDPSSSAAVNDAILAFLLKPAADTATAEALLLRLAGNFAASGLSPQRFNAVYSERLADLQRRVPALATPVAALRDAYTPRGPDQLYREPPEASWWKRWNRPGEPREVWSRCLRTIGDGYNQGGSRDLAASFYEAAVGYPGTQFLETWVDLDALLPLGVIYVVRAGQTQDPGAVQHLNELIDRLFQGKGAAYESGDLPRIRSFHITLGKMYADRGQWGDMYNARSAVFQLERMQMMTRRMRQEGDTAAFDPPQLLETLAKGYFATRRIPEGQRTALAAAATFGRLGRQADSAGAVQLAETGSTRRRDPQRVPRYADTMAAPR